MASLIWNRAPQPGDNFALSLVNPEQADLKRLRTLFSHVTMADAGHQKQLSREAIEGFRGWFQNVNEPLPSQAYGRLSNWFLTTHHVAPSTHLADRARDLWRALFAVTPTSRLTDPEHNGQIVELAFDAWWSNQQKAQGQHDR